MMEENKRVNIQDELAKASEIMQEADYNPSYLFTREDFVGFKKEAQEMFDRIRTYLAGKGYL